MDMEYDPRTYRIADIHCPSCGAPALYDIRSGTYTCRYCGGRVSVSEAQAQKRGFRKLQQDKLRESANHYHLQHARCSGCGAEVVFEKDEALTSCAFCGRALVRQEYLYQNNLPEIVIPFRITPPEAKTVLADWCDENKRKKEAGILRKNMEKLKGFYLPYEFLRGPVTCGVSRYSGGLNHSCDGFIDEVFVNSSAQLDNLLLDGMEPFDLEELTAFDFAYVAGHQVKTDNISGKELEKRVKEEVGESYAPAVRKVLETEAVRIDPNTSSLVRMPALLPVYYVFTDGVMAAVNGQTGKVSVRSIKEYHYYFLPWWLKAVLATLAITAVLYIGFTLFRIDTGTKQLLTGILAFFMLIVMLAAYSDTDRMKFRVERGRKIFTSGKKAYRRTEGVLEETTPPQRNVTPPVFFENLDGERKEVVIRFSSPLRFIGMILSALVVLFLPVIIALLLNGFDFERLELGGSAVWFCIFVPVIPVYLLKFGGIELYRRPWIYTVEPDGTKKRYRKKGEGFLKSVLMVLKVLFVPPACFAVWAGIGIFCLICYLTAFGF